MRVYLIFYFCHLLWSTCLLYRSNLNDIVYVARLPYILRYRSVISCLQWVVELASRVRNDLMSCHIALRIRPFTRLIFICSMYWCNYCYYYIIWLKYINLRVLVGIIFHTGKSFILSDIWVILKITCCFICNNFRLCIIWTKNKKLKIIWTKLCSYMVRWRFNVILNYINIEI